MAFAVPYQPTQPQVDQLAEHRGNCHRIRHRHRNHRPHPKTSSLSLRNRRNEETKVSATSTRNRHCTTAFYAIGVGLSGETVPSVFRSSRGSSFSLEVADWPLDRRKRRSRRMLDIGGTRSARPTLRSRAKGNTWGKIVPCQDGRIPQRTPFGNKKEFSSQPTQSAMSESSVRLFEK